MSPQRKSSDKPYIWMVRRSLGLVPATPYDAELLDRYKIDSHVTCTIEQPQDDRLNRKFHGLIGLVAKGTGDDPRALKTQLIIKAGYITSIDHFDGSTGFTPARTSELDGAEYEALYQKVLEVILTEILPGMDRDDLVAQVLDYTGGRHGQ